MKTFAFLIALAAAALPVHSAPPSETLFARSSMERVDLNGLRVWLGAPVRLTSQLGWRTVWGQHASDSDDGTFIHLTPVMARFPGGNLVATYAMDPDNQDDPVTLSAFQISPDGGAHWGRRYTVLMQHNPMIFIPDENDSLLAVPSELAQAAPGDDRNFVGVSWRFQKGGNELLMVPDGIRVLDWPWPLANFESPQPRENWQVGMRITGSVTKVEGRWLITAEIQKKDDPMNRDLHAVILASTDLGRTWRYHATLGDPEPALDARPGYEGPNEPFILPLSAGTLMGVYRVGSGEEWHLRRNYSHDGGRTWSRAEPLPAWSVKPQLVRTADGVVALTTGRPGIYLWLSTDPLASSWQSIDLVRHHNRSVSTAAERIASFQRHGKARWQTTSYTGLVDLGHGRLLMAYDRDAERTPASADDRSCVYVLPIELEKIDASR